MKGFFVKVTGVFVGTLAALFGISAANVAASVPDIKSKEKALYLEHGKSISGNPKNMLTEHYSHASGHESSVKIQSQTDKAQKVKPVKNKAKATQKTDTKELDKEQTTR